MLVNGRRHITAQPGDFLVDVNTIPTDLIERVDVITGGSSAVYGSDAVAGVVNFVLRRDFDGIRLRGQAGISQQGDRGIQFVSLTAGRNFCGRSRQRRDQPRICERRGALFHRPPGADRRL